MEFLKRAFNLSFLFLGAIVLVLSGCDGELLGSLDNDRAPGNYCPTFRLSNGQCPEFVESIFSWDFLTNSNYTYNTNYIEVSGGSANLLTVDQLHSGTDFNSGTHVGTRYDSVSNRVKLKDKASPEETHVNLVLPDRANVLLGYWHFEGDFSDSGPLSNTATNSGSEFLNDSKLGTGLSFDGDDWVDLETNVASAEKGTASIWFKSDFDFTTDGMLFYGTQSSSGIANGFGSHHEFHMHITGDEELGFFIEGTSGGGDVRITSVETFADGQWHHAVATWDVNGDAVLYVDAREVGRATHDAHSTVASATFRLGRTRGDTRYFNGEMDEAVFWSEALTADEVLAIYNSQSTNFTELSSSWTPHWNSIVGYWKMDGNWQDSSGNGNHGTAIGDSTFDSEVKVGTQSGIFDGAGDYVTVGTSPFFEESVTSMSISFWAYVDPATFDGGAVALIDSAAGDTTINNGFFLYLEDRGGGQPTNSLYASVKTTAGREVVVGINNIFTSASWYNITMTYGSDELKLWVNAKNAVSSLAVDSSGNFIPRNDLLAFGAQNNGIGPFNGRIDDLSLWSAELSYTDVKNIYNRQKQKYAGHYDSPVIDLGTSGSWTNLDTVTSLPFGKEIVAQTSESSSDYSSLSGDLSNNLLGLWHFDEINANSAPSGNDFEDFSGNNNHGVELAGATYAANGVLRKSVYLEDSEYLEIPVTATPYSKGTWAFWYRPGVDVASASNEGIFGTLSDPKLRMFIHSNEIRFDFFEGGYHGIGNLTNASDYLSTKKWSYITFVFDFTTDYLALYIDGELRHDGTMSSSKSPISSGTSFRLGYTWNGGNGGSGYFDEFSVWSRDLSATEIQQLYRRGSNRVKYQVKSCVDSSCNCKSFSTSPVGSVSDCDGDGTPNSTDTDDTFMAEFIGPGGDGATSYSELFNRAPSDLTFNCTLNTSDSDNDICMDDEITLSGDSNETPPRFSFGNMAASANPTNNRYFQYRVMMEAEENTACSGEACLPELTSVEVGPTGRYYGGSPVISPVSPISYSDISSMSFTEGGSCSLTYQLSPDGSTYYYHNGSNWISATGENVSESSSGSSMSSNIGTFKNIAGSGNLYFKAFMTSDTSQSCSLDKVEVVKPN